MQELRSVWGVPLYRDGSDLPPRMGQSVVENQNANANNVTDYINFADKCLWDETLYKCVLIKWDDVVLRQERVELMDTEFQVNLDLKPTQYGKSTHDRMPMTMIAKAVEMHALRAAFSQLGKVYIEEELAAINGETASAQPKQVIENCPSWALFQQHNARLSNFMDIHGKLI